MWGENVKKIVRRMEDMGVSSNPILKMNLFDLCDLYTYKIEWHMDELEGKYVPSGLLNNFRRDYALFCTNLFRRIQQEMGYNENRIIKHLKSVNDWLIEHNIQPLAWHRDGRPIPEAWVYYRRPPSGWLSTYNNLSVLTMAYDEGEAIFAMNISKSILPFLPWIARRQPKFIQKIPSGINALILGMATLHQPKNMVPHDISVLYYSLMRTDADWYTYAFGMTTDNSPWFGRYMEELRDWRNTMVQTNTR